MSFGGGRTTFDQLPRIEVEEASNSIMLIDSADRSFGTSFNFSVDLKHALKKARYIRCVSCIIPKLNNVNSGNNTFTMVHTLGSASVTLTPAMYNTTTIANELTSAINASFVTAGIADTVTVSFVVNQRAFTITSVNGDDMYITSESDIIVYGKTLIPFDSQPTGTVVAGVGSVIYSDVAAMLPTRYLFIASNALCGQEFANSICSSANKPSSLIGIVYLCDIYQDDDWDVSKPFKGIYEELEVKGNNINVYSASNELPRFVDIEMYDGYSRPLGSMYSLTAPYPTETNLSCVLGFEIKF